MIAAILLAVPPALTLSLDDALARAREDPAAVIARAEAEVARRRIDVARAPASPVLTLGRTRFSAREEVSVTQEIRWAGERRFGVLSAHELASSAAEAAARAELEARRDVRHAWFDLAAAEDTAALAGDTLARAHEFHDSVSARFEGGRAPRLDAVRAAAELARASAEALAADEERRAAWAHLATLLGLPARDEGATDATRPPALADAAVDALAARGPDAHPTVRAAASAVSAARAARRQALARRWPGLALTAGVNADDPGLPGPDWQGTIGLTLPFGARTAPIGVTEAELALEEARLDAARRQVAETLETAYRRLRGAAAQLRAYDTEALPAASEAAQLTREAYAFGRGDIFRVLETERALIDARRARVAAYRELKRSEAELLAAAGEADAPKD